MTKICNCCEYEYVRKLCTSCLVENCACKGQDVREKVDDRPTR